MPNAYYWWQGGREGGQKSQKPAYVIHGCSLTRGNGTYFFEFLWQFPKNMVFVKEFSLESMLEIFGNSRSHIPWQFAISHIFFHLFDLKNLIIKNHDKYLQKKAALITNAQMGFGYRQFGKKNDASKKIWRRFGLKSRKSWQATKLTQKSAFFLWPQNFFSIF